MPRPITPERLFADNQRLAYFAVHRWMATHTGAVERYRLERDDLESIALLALWKVAQHFTPERGRFSTFATTAIYSRLALCLRYHHEKKRDDGKEPALRLDAPVAGTTMPLADVLPARAPSINTTVYLRQSKAALWDAIDTLPDVQAEILRLRFADDLTYAQIGTARGVSRQRAEQLAKKGLATLRETCGHLSPQSA